MNGFKKIVVATMAFAMSALTVGQAAAGGFSDGGGFAYNGSRMLLKLAAERAVIDLGYKDESCVAQTLASAGLKSVNLDEMRRIIRDVRLKPTGEVERANLQGELEPLAMDFGSDKHGKFIVALKPFFIGYMSYPTHALSKVATGVAASMVYQVETLLIHEATHLFGYGEREAQRFVALFSDSTNQNLCSSSRYRPLN
jgi:hypothetical protein